MALGTATYCTEDDIADRLSQTGVDLRIDDTPPDDLGRAIERAAAQVEMYCFAYDPTSLLGSRVVRELAADLATHFLCRRRGNPSMFQAEYEEAMEQLREIKGNNLILPDAARRKSAVPVGSNHRVLGRPPRVVTMRRTSTGKPENYQQINDPLDRVASAIPLDRVI